MILNFTAEAQRTQRALFFSIALRGRQLKNNQPRAENMRVIHKFYGKHTTLFSTKQCNSKIIYAFCPQAWIFYLPSFLSASFFGGSAANKK